MDDILPKLNIFAENNHLGHMIPIPVISHKLPYNKSTLFEGASFRSHKNVQREWKNVADLRYMQRNLQGLIYII